MEKIFGGRGFSREVALYKAKIKAGWEVIDFDDLQPMIKAAKNYIQVFAPDLVYLERKHYDAYKLRAKAGRKIKHPIIYNIGLTKGIYEELLNYKFAICPETQKIWLELTPSTISSKKQNQFYIASKPLKEQWINLTGAAIFMLLLWTAMKRNELRMLKADALLVDGKAMDLEKDVMEQVERGQCFDLRRTVTKTEETLGGKDFFLPLPKIGAQAFAVLFEFYRNLRKLMDNKFLLPAGGLHLYYSIGEKTMRSSSGPICRNSIYNFFLHFCYLAEVERQHPHKCRKTLATLMINHDPSALELIRDLLCHKSVAMTVVYLMSLPGVAEDIQNYMLEKQREKIVEYLTDAAEGRLALPFTHKSWNTRLGSS